MNYGQRFMTFYGRQGVRPSPRKRNAKKQNSCLRRSYKELWKVEKWKAKEKRKDIPIWMQSFKEEQGDIKSLPQWSMLEKAMATHSSTLACKIPWTEEPGGLPSMGSHRVGHDWSDFTSTFHFHALKEMATHSSVLAWRIPGTGEPGGLPSVGLHRVGHDWSDLAL